MVVGHPLLEVADDGFLGVLVQLDVVRVDAVDLRPALAAAISQSGVDVDEGLVDLLRDELGDVEVGVVEATCEFLSVFEGSGERGEVPWPAQWICSPTRAAEEYQWLFLLASPKPG